ncbi:hypothetical protein BB560_006925 [Smittium megazygosporum]|uniref:Coatomer subunit gamma n=1 Tax=Smittium megazygosporum TaxID=133381 RepID=A0A2T9Y0A9_9FUNG|nr:hypothetical protein BB560_006925 [Smittium megazygosporum]
MSWKKDEDQDELGALLSLDKSSVLQEARMFNQTPIRPRNCRLLLAKLMYLLQRGDTLTTTEATGLFFSITKLFQSNDLSLKQMVYLAIKELSEISEDVIMVTSSLMKDMQPKSDEQYRAKALRVLCKITDASMLPSIERYIKSAITDRNTAISSSALVSAFHLNNKARDTVRRWSSEVQEVVSGKTLGGSFSFFTSNSSSPNSLGITQYHALGTLYALKQNDRIAVAKIVQGFSSGARGGSAIENSFAHVLLIRYAVKVMSTDPSHLNSLYSMLEEWVRYRTEIVCLEAARAIVELENAPMKLVTSAVSSLQSLLSSSKAVVRFSAVRTLDHLAVTRPEAVQPCNMDIESLVNDSCRSVSTLAITTLLKTGNEASVDRLMKVMEGFMSEISDEFRTIVAEAVGNLCIKFPQKHSSFLSFLSGALRNEGGFDFKQSIVNSIFSLVKTVKECREIALTHLCEFIEDCEFSKLSVQILHFLGIEGPYTSMPSIYIRHIYNRVVLENAQVRAAAVLALAKFGASTQPDGKLRNSIIVLLKRCLDDRDDEVRDRAVWALRFINNESIISRYISDDSTYSLQLFESKLVEYLSNPNNNFNSPVSISSVPKISRDQDTIVNASNKPKPTIEAAFTESAGLSTDTHAPSLASGTIAFAPEINFSAVLKSIPEFESYGEVIVSSRKPEELTEPETEYTVVCYKHIYPRHIVFQFECANTLSESLLEQVFVEMTSTDGLDMLLVPEFVIPIQQLTFNSPSSTFVSFERIDTENIATGSFQCALKFKTFECDPDTQEKLDPEDTGFDDMYALEPIELDVSDYVLATLIPDWKQLWDTLENKEGEPQHELISSFQLPQVTSLKGCVENLNQALGMFATDASLNPTNKVAHQAVFMGLFEAKAKTIVRARMTFEEQTGVTLELCIRSEDFKVCNIILSSIV